MENAQTILQGMLLFGQSIRELNQQLYENATDPDYKRQLALRLANIDETTRKLQQVVEGSND
jgi:hypothetical protein